MKSANVPARIELAIAVLAGTVALTGCGAGGGGGSSAAGGNAVRVLMVNNPQQVELQSLTAQYFTKQTGIKVLILPPSVGGVKGVDNYIDLMKFDMSQLASAVR